MILNGANGYITKGSSPDELINAIKIIFKHGMYYSTHFTRPLINAIKQNLINIPNITPREQQVLKLSCSDLSYAEIAKRIRVSIRSVDGFRESLFRKLRVNSRTGLALFAVQFGFVPIDVNINGNLKKNL
jgi:DNA-binding NarL/FixJ family response regulator